MTTTSYTDAVNLINPAYNPNVPSYFPQPITHSSSVASSAETSLPHESVDVDKSNQPQTVELWRRKSTGVLRCEICSVSCNSKMMLDKHILGKKHRKKTKEVNVPWKEHAFMGESTDIDAAMLEASSNLSHDVLEIHIPKHHEFSLSVADDTCNSREADKNKLTLLKADCSADLMSNACAVEVKHKDDLGHLDCASKTSGRVCTVCNIFSNSWVAFEKHLAGRTHARKIKYRGAVMSSSMGVYPGEVPDSNALKLARDAHTPTDPSSVVPVNFTENNETIHSESGNASRSPNMCTLCNIKCNSLELFKGHLSGRKHASKVRSLGSSVQIPYLSNMDHGTSRKLPLVQSEDPDPAVNGNDASSISQMVLQDSSPSDKSIISLDSYATPKTISVKIQPKDDSFSEKLDVCLISNGTNVNEATMQYYESETTQRASKRGKIVQFAYCDVCKIYCDSSETLGAHMMGKRHMKQLEKLEKLERGIQTLAEDMIALRTVDSMAYQDASKKLSVSVASLEETSKGMSISQNDDTAKNI